MFKERIEAILAKLVKERVLVEVPKSNFGDYSSNILLRRKNIDSDIKSENTSLFVKDRDEELSSKELISLLENDEFFSKVENIKGFLNFTLSDRAYIWFLENFNFNFKQDDKNILIEYGSCNPTGPLHVGGARNIILGDTVASFLEFRGNRVFKEYYVNDIGSQVEQLATSLLERVRELKGLKPRVIQYLGDYVIEMAKEYILLQEHQDSSLSKVNSILSKEEFTHEEIKEAKLFALACSLKDVKEVLTKIDVHFNHFVSEESLYKGRALQELVEELESKDLIYRLDDAVWMKTTNFGDDKDRVIVKSDGQPAYYCSDLLYTKNKVVRNFDKIVSILGADHAGYLSRYKASFEVQGYKNHTLVEYQMVHFLRDKKVVKMSKRSGEFVTLAELLDEIGKDAIRFFFLSRKANTPMEIDLELAKSKSNENPLFYIQYAHARICSLMKKNLEKEEEEKEQEENNKGAQLDKDQIKTKKDGVRKFNDFNLNDFKFNITTQEEKNILKKLSEFESVLIKTDEDLEVNRILTYALELASLFHTMYNVNRVLEEEKEIRYTRLYIFDLVKQALVKLASIMKITLPETM